MTRRHRTEAERDAAQVRFDQMIAAETKRQREAAEAAISAMTDAERRRRADEAIAKYGGAA